MMIAAEWLVLSAESDNISEAALHSGLNSYPNKEDWKVDLHSELNSYPNKEDWKADISSIDLSTIPSEVWTYVTRELTVAAGLTPEQEAKLDQIITNLSNIPTDVENAEAIARYTR